MSKLPATSSVPTSRWHEVFIQMLPKIEQHTRIVFRDRNRDARAEAVQEVVCNACVAFARLAEQGRTHVATWSSLAKYAVAQVQDGRRVGTSLNIHDVSSQHCQQRKSVEVQSLYHWDRRNEEWTEMLVEDRHSTPAERAIFRLDFRDFLRSLSRRDRKFALTHLQQLCFASDFTPTGCVNPVWLWHYVLAPDGCVVI